jgi:hypothetical protein
MGGSDLFSGGHPGVEAEFVFPQQKHMGKDQGRRPGEIREEVTGLPDGPGS